MSLRMALRLMVMVLKTELLETRGGTEMALLAGE